MFVGALLRVGAWSAGIWNGSWILTDTHQYWALSSDGLAGYRATDGWLYVWGLVRPPGYPAILWLLRQVSDGFGSVALLQIGFGVAAIVVTYGLASRIASRAEAAVAAWWVALSPIHVVFTSVLLTEVPFSVFLLTAVLLMSPLVGSLGIERWRWAGAGLAVGLATLIRPIALYLPVVVIAAVAISRVRARLALPMIVFLLAFAIPVSAWIARNHHATGIATVSTIEGFNLAYYRAAGAMAAQERIPVDRARRQILAMVEADREPGMNPAELSRVQARVGIRVILDHPIGFVFSSAKGLALTLLGPARSHFIRRFQDSPAAGLTPLLAAGSLVSALAMLIAGAGGACSLIFAREWRKLVLLGVPLLYLLAIGSGQESWARFRLPIEPLLATLAAIGVVHVTRARAGRG